MLVSKTHNIAFAHYPKSGGTSFVRWFRQVFPDATYVSATDIHESVRPSLELLGLVKGFPTRSRVMRRCISACTKILPLRLDREPCDLRIIGIVREPFEMLVSLYEYWRRMPRDGNPSTRLARVACTQSFRAFVELAVVGRRLSNYETFFDIGGPAWPTTRLLDFSTLGNSLTAVCDELGIQTSVQLGRHNCAPRRIRETRDYADEAGDLMREVRRYFGWYYEQAEHLVLRDDRHSFRRAA